MRVAATPHLDTERGNGIHAPEVRELTQRVQEVVGAAGIPLQIDPGQELYLVPEAPDLLSRDIALPLGESRAVLVELSLTSGVRPRFLEDTLFRLELDGYRPILAHPERYAFVQRNLNVLDVLVGSGLPLQLTAPALLGEYGSGIRKTAERLLRRGAYALAGSDRHHPGPARSLTVLHERIARLVDRATADLLLVTNPARLLAGEPVLQPEGFREEQPSLLARLFGS